MIEINSKSDCPYCAMAKKHLINHGIPYNEILYDDVDRRQSMYDSFGLTGRQRTVPQIFLVQNGRREYIGGYNDLLRADWSARLSMEAFNADF